MLYVSVKHLHIMLATLSMIFFVLRACGSVREAPWRQRRWVKVVPHILDTLLLMCGLILMIQLRAWPQQTPWLAAKLIALLFYIGLGTMAIKRGRTPRQRALFALAALAAFFYIVAVAVHKTPLPPWH